MSNMRPTESTTKMGSKNSSTVLTIWEEHEMMEPTTRGPMSPVPPTSRGQEPYHTMPISGSTTGLGQSHRIT